MRDGGSDWLRAWMQEFVTSRTGELAGGFEFSWRGGEGREKPLRLGSPPLLNP